jgi:hypothetical protein
MQQIPMTMVGMKRVGRPGRGMKFKRPMIGMKKTPNSSMHAFRHPAADMNTPLSTNIPPPRRADPGFGGSY